MPSTRFMIVSASCALLFIFYLLGHKLAPDWAEKAEPRYVIEQLSRFVRNAGPYAYLLILIAALAEALPPLGVVVSGLGIIVTAGVLASQGELSLLFIIGAAGTGFAVAYAIDFALGFYGWGRLAKYLGLEPSLRRMTERIRRHRLLFIVLLGHPTLGGLAATAAGVLRLPFRQTVPLIIIGGFSWATLWAGVAYLMGPFLLQLITGEGAFFAILALILGTESSRQIRQARNKKALSKEPSFPEFGLGLVARARRRWLSWLVRGTGVPRSPPRMSTRYCPEAEDAFPLEPHLQERPASGWNLVVGEDGRDRLELSWQIEPDHRWDLH
jgi:membrane protein DedA with SNARE-associated domain